MVDRLKSRLKSLLKAPVEAYRRARRKKTIKAQARHLSYAELCEDLRALPIRDGAVVLAHSSLKALGFVEGGPQAVVDALVQVIVRERGGTAMLPVYSIDGTMHETLKSGRIFDVKSTPSNLGAIPEAFRRHPEAKRSAHPSHSFAAIGPLADWLTKDHHKAGTSFGKDTPMARLLETPSYLLGLGTHLGAVTFYHCLEDLEDFPLDVYTPEGPFEAMVKDYAGETHRLSLDAHWGERSTHRIDRPTSGALRDFYAERLAKNAGLSWHKVGAGRAWLVDAQAMYQEIKSLMNQGLTIYVPAETVEAFKRQNQN